MAQSQTSNRQKPVAAESEQRHIPVPLNFRVPSEFRREFKIYAAQKGVHMNELVQHAFAALKEKDRG